MDFTENEKLKLFKYGFDGDGKLIIKGISGMGNEFETSGIVSSFNGRMEIYDNVLIIDLGQNPVYLHGINEKRTISAPFSTTINKYIIKNIYEKKPTGVDNVKSTLFIKSIEDEAGNLLYENKDYENIIVPVIMDLKEERKEKLSKTNQYMDGSIDNVSAKIQQMTGKPVIIDGYSFVPSGIDEFDTNGRPVGIDASFKSNDNHIYINDKSTISVLKDNALVEIASNDYSDVKDLFEERKNLINNSKEPERQ